MNNNMIILEGCLEEFKSENNLTSYTLGELFEIFSLLLITKESEASYSELEECIVDGGNDGGIDSLVFLINDQVINNEDQLTDIKFKPRTLIEVLITQSKFEKSFKEDPINRLISSIPFILNLEIYESELLKRFNSVLVERILLFRIIWKKAIIKKSALNIKVIYACKADKVEINEAFSSKVDQLLNIIQKDLSNAEIEFVPLSAEELLHIYQKSVNETLELKFCENPISMPFCDEEYGYIGVVKLKDYYDFITDNNGQIRETIFEQNIRHFQGKVDVNKKITLTLETDFIRDFWWLNNGITIVCNDCRPIPKALFLENAQIVNGLQTSFTIHNSLNIQNDADNRSILVKVIKSQNKETIDKIIAGANSQNYVPPVLLRATDDIQRNIETFCLTKGYYYDRRKNYYKNLNKPVSKIISIQNMAQAIESILYYNPSDARSKPTTLVKNDNSYHRIFNPNINFLAYLNCSLIVDIVKDFIKSTLEKENKQFVVNFTYHFARLLTSIIIGKNQYTSEEIADLDFTKANGGTNIKVYNYLKKIILEYKELNPSENIINISKSKKFSEFLNSQSILDD